MKKQNFIEIEQEPRERAIAVAVGLGNSHREENLEHLDELEFLAETAGADVMQKVYQERHTLDGATAIGKGKLQELKESIEQDNITLVIFDNELSPAQFRNLERELQVKVMDRSAIILDIFAAHARTIEAKTQVELAQLQYLLPRLSRMWTHLSKQYGGIGTKGPGETQIETDRRLVRDRISLLKSKLEKIDRQRAEQRKGREELPRFALVGYTNAGKSTLMNALSGAEVYVKDQLFATLDTTVRAFELPNGKHALLSDTVGFIRKLPTHLVASFRSTLAETLEADVLLHVVDVSHPAFREHMAAVAETLEALDAHEKPTIVVFNKIDRLENLDEVHSLREDFVGSVAVSAAKGIGIAALQERLLQAIEQSETVFTMHIPYSDMSVLSKLYETSEIITREDTENGVELSIKVPSKFTDVIQRSYEKFIVSE